MLPTRRRPAQAPAGARRSCCAWRRCAALRASCSLLALDFARRVRGDLHRADGQGGRCATATGRGTRRYDEAQEHDRVRLPGDGAAVRPLGPVRRARRSARACRGSSPRCSRSTVVALIFALVNGEQYSSYYIFYGTLVFAIVYVGVAALGLRAGHRRAAARRRLPPPRGARRLGQAHRGRRARARRRGARAGRDGRLHLAHAAARQRPALARADRGPRRRCSTPTASRR